MILSTRGSDTIVAKAFNRQEVAASKLETIIDSLATDPSLGTTTKEAFIVSSDDLRNKKAAEAFFQACATKHPDSFVLVIAKEKDGEQKYQMPGVDMVLFRPRPEALNQIVVDRVSSIAQKTQIHSAFDQTPQGIEAYQAPSDVFEAPPPLAGNEPPPFPEFDPSLLDIEYPDETPETPPAEPLRVGSVNSPMSARLAAAGKLGEVSQIVTEISASSIMRDLIAREGQAATLNDMLRTQKEKIYAILVDRTSGDTTEQKMQKVKAAIHDRSQYQASLGSAVEQTVGEIIDIICTTVEDRIGERVESLDRAIYNASITDDVSSEHAKMQTLNIAKANIMMELTTLSAELKAICEGTVRLTQDAASQLAADAMDATGSALLNDKLFASREAIISYEVIQCISQLMDKGTHGVDRLREASLKVEMLLNSVNKLLDIDKEAIAAQQSIVRYLHASNIEDTVIAQTLLKKSLRVWVGAEGTGRTVVPYVLSRMKSRANANVLLIDLTGTAKYDNYGIKYRSLDAYLSQRNEDRFCLVVGDMPEDTEMIQRLYTQINRAADFYRVINVVVSTSQKKALDILSQDVLCINYITDVQRRNIDAMRTFIEDTKKDNVGQRIVLNKCSVPTYTVLEALGVNSRIDIALVTIPVIHSVEECAFYGTDPAETESVQEGFREANKYA